MKDFTSVVTDIRLQSREGTSGVWQMSLDATEFRVGDRGALEAETRSGTRLTIPVTAVVVDDDGVLWHVVAKPLAAGTDVVGRVNGSEVSFEMTAND